jgi:hypothetical protein
VLRTLARPLAAKLLARHGPADPAWARTLAIPGDEEFPALALPEGRLRYDTQRSYPISLAARAIDGPCLVVQIASFDTAEHAASHPGWAIPAATTPRTDDERIRNALGFEEGWEDAEPECLFVCDARLGAFWRAARDRRRFGLTVAGAASIYPVRLGEIELPPLDAFLAALRPK